MHADATPPAQMDADGRALIAALPALLPLDAAPAALITVVSAQGSAPRGPGARMLVRDGHLLAGTIGGGHLEQRALDEACALLATTPNFAPTLRSWALGPALAQCCGGRVAVRLEPISGADGRALAARLNAAETSDGWFETGEADHLLRERPTAPWTIVIFGAGHVARALAQVLQVQPWRVIVVDERPEWADSSAFPLGTTVIAQPPVAALSAWGWLDSPAGAPQAATMPATAEAAPAWSAEVGVRPSAGRSLAVIMTHDHERDRQLAWALLRRVDTGQTPLPYVGVIGSKTKISTLRRRLNNQGVSAAALDQLVAPIGLRAADAAGVVRPIGGKRPGEIAISVAAELLVRVAALEAGAV